MIEITDKKKCTGCGACASKCPHTAISLAEDEEGCKYPVTNKEKCVNCGLCNQVCPMLDERHGVPLKNANKLYCFAAQLHDKDLLAEVSSGGAFWALACSIIDKKGVIYGAAQENVDHIFHIRAENLAEAEQIRRSKYLQSEVGNMYALVKKDVIAGRLVLFTGTPCQIAALNCFLGKDYTNLCTCEVVCHGVPSMLAWRKYREETEQRDKKHFKMLIFRDKSKGWRHNQYKITYDDNSFNLEASTKHKFHSGYLVGLFYRPSCGSCPFASLPRVADITLADYWKYKGRLINNQEDIGVSLIMANNDKGVELITESKKYLDLEKTDKQSAISSCRHLTKHPLESSYRSKFMKILTNDGYYIAFRKNILKAKIEYALRRFF